MKVRSNTVLDLAQMCRVIMMSRRSPKQVQLTCMDYRDPRATATIQKGHRSRAESVLQDHGFREYWVGGWNEAASWEKKQSRARARRRG